jgi:hypothetical protein
MLIARVQPFNNVNVENRKVTVHINNLPKWARQTMSTMPERLVGAQEVHDLFLPAANGQASHPH